MKPTQQHTNIPRCQHQHNGHQCQLDAGHDHKHGTPCAYTTIGDVDTITRWHPTHPHLAETLDMPSRAPYTAIKDPTGKRTKLCAECGAELERAIHKYCGHDCRLAGRYRRRAANTTARRQDAA